MSIKVSTNIQDVAKEITEELKAYQKGLKDKIWDALGLLESEILQNIRKKSGLKVRTGALLNSVGSTKKVDVDSQGNVYGEIGTQGIPYAAIHEFGGTIRPKNKKFLAIPIGDNRRPDGLPKVTTSDLMGGLGRSFIRNGTIFAVEGKNKIKPMFTLKKEVTVPARPYLRPALAAKKDQIVKDFGLFIAAAFKTKE